MNTMQLLERMADSLARIEQLLVQQQTMTFNKDTLDLDEAAAYTKYSKGYLYHLTSERRIPHCKRGRKIYFDKERLDSWLKLHPIKSDAELASEAETYCVTRKNLFRR